jgi:hypothetical protein
MTLPALGQHQTQLRAHTAVPTAVEADRLLLVATKTYIISVRRSPAMTKTQRNGACFDSTAWISVKPAVFSTLFLRTDLQAITQAERTIHRKSLTIHSRRLVGSINNQMREYYLSRLKYSHPLILFALRSGTRIEGRTCAVEDPH